MTLQETGPRVHTHWRGLKGTTAGTLDDFVIGVRAGSSVAGATFVCDTFRELHDEKNKRTKRRHR